MRKLSISFYIAWLFLTHQSIADDSVFSNKLSSVKVTEVTKISQNTFVLPQFCSDFSLSQTQAQVFLTQAKPITKQQLHNQYDWLPCSITGTAELDGQNCEWEINAGGVGRVVCGNEAALFVGESGL